MSLSVLPIEFDTITPRSRDVLWTDRRPLRRQTLRCGVRYVAHDLTRHGRQMLRWPGLERETGVVSSTESRGAHTPDPLRPRGPTATAQHAAVRDSIHLVRNDGNSMWINGSDM